MIPKHLVPAAAKTSFVLALVLAAAAYLISGCGPSAYQRTLKTTLASVNAARAAFVVWDDQTQARAVAEATSLVDGQTKLAAHRQLRNKVLLAFEAAYRALAIAAADEEASWRLTAAISATASLWAVYTATVEPLPAVPALATPAQAGGK